ncbi:MAG: segregation/condensation protein A [Acidobacteriota bacterium]
MTDRPYDPIDHASEAAEWDAATLDAGSGAAAETDALSQEPAPAHDSDAYRVQLPVFEGPLDLLLHLIRVNEINIYDIPIVEVTRQYGEHLEMMQELNLELAGEYLIMAATLIYIKSKMMLPRPPSEEEPREDPRAELRDRLLEHQRFKEAAQSLAQRDQEAARVWSLGAPAAELTQGEVAIEATLYDLLTAFQSVLRSIGEDLRLEFRRDTLRVADAISRIWELLELVPSLLFDELLRRQRSRAQCIVTFLALLEMMRLQMLRATQVRRGGEILIWRRTPSLLAAPRKLSRSARGAEARIS